MEANDKLKALIEQVAQDLAIEVVEHDLFRAGRRQVMRIYIYKPEGITVDHCAEFSHRLSALFDIEDPIAEAYTLEVSSPGLDRPLKTQRDFERNLGRDVRVQLGKGKPIKGSVVSATPEGVELAVATGNQKFNYADILSAKIDLKL